MLNNHLGGTALGLTSSKAIRKRAIRTLRMGIHTQIKLDIFGVLNPRKYPPFPPATDPDLDTGSVGVSTGEDR